MEQNPNEQSAAQIAAEAIRAIAAITRSAIGAIHSLADDRNPETAASVSPNLRALLDNRDLAGAQNLSTRNVADIMQRPVDSRLDPQPQEPTDGTDASQLGNLGEEELEEETGAVGIDPAAGKSPNDIIRMMQGNGAQTAPANGGPTPNEMIQGGLTPTPAVDAEAANQQEGPDPSEGATE